MRRLASVVTLTVVVPQRAARRRASGARQGSAASGEARHAQPVGGEVAHRGARTEWNNEARRTINGTAGLRAAQGFPVRALPCGAGTDAACR